MTIDKKAFKIYDANLNLKGILEDYSEATFCRSFYAAGQFTITINNNLPNASLLTKKSIVIYGDDVRDSGIITQLTSSIDEDGKGSQILVATGYDLRFMFMQRVIRELNSADAYYASGASETVIKDLIASQCGSTSAYPNRVFSLLEIATDRGRGSNYTLNTKYTTVYEECETAATQSELGWFVYPDLVNKKYILDCEEGLDRSTSQVVNPFCIFDPDMESLRSANFDDDTTGFRNFVYVGGDGTGANRTIHDGYDTTEPTDFDRFEMFDDASGLSTTADLTTEAAAVLKQYNQAYTLEGQGLIKSPFIYKEQYNVGDIVTVKFSGNTLNVRILDVTESWSYGQYDIDATWGRPIQTVSTQLGSVATTITSKNSTSESGTNVSGMKNGVKSYDLSSANATMLSSECIYNVLEITGTLTTNRTLTLYLDTVRLYGRKIYNVIISASGGYVVTVTTGISGKSTVDLEASGVTREVQLYVDDTGNVTRSERRTSNIDGGAAASVYGTEQVIDGGAA